MAISGMKKFAMKISAAATVVKLKKEADFGMLRAA